MRKDVKLGFAIGGVLLAVLVVYVLVISGDEKRPEQVALATNNTEPQAKKTEDPKPSPVPIAAAIPATAPAETPKPDAPKADAPVADAPAPSSVTPAVDPKPTTEPAVATASGVDRWADGVLDTGKLPMMMTTTPETPAPTPAPIPAAANRPTNIAADNNSNPGASSNTSAMIATSPSQPAGQPAKAAAPSASAGGTHVVQPNETFSSIAAAVYGNSAYFPHLIRANPTIDPRKLHAGMTINLPAINDVRVVATQAQGSDAPARTAAAPATVDPKTQYKVQSGDNLSRISIKLYGKPDHVEKIYDLNKTTIGPDMAKVKVGMVLSLPEPPTKMN